jgi:hypothetical protein
MIEVFIPTFQKQNLIFLNYFSNPVKFIMLKASSFFQNYRIEPEFCDHLFSLHMNVRWFRIVDRDEEETILADYEYSWHEKCFSRKE